MRFPLNRLLAGGLDQRFEPFLKETAGTVKIILTHGTYLVDLVGGSGAGGTDNNGSGGCGGMGKHEQFTIILTRPMAITVSVGEGGKIRTDGNGGKAGTLGSRYERGVTGADTVKGYGGGGGFPTYIVINGVYYIAQGGGGGGGAGQLRGTGRYSGGGGGGGGGGLYFLTSEGVLTSILGMDGPGGAGCYQAGWDGLVGNTSMFPSVRSSNGTVGSEGRPAGVGQFGAGSSGGAGSGSHGNHSSATGGHGGGGAGGDGDAGAGESGSGAITVKTVPTEVFDWQGLPTNLGKGGLPNENGNNGWVWIRQIQETPDPEPEAVYKENGNVQRD